MNSPSRYETLRLFIKQKIGVIWQKRNILFEKVTHDSYHTKQKEELYPYAKLLHGL